MLLGFCCLFSSWSSGQSNDYEDFRVEVTSSFWLVSTSGEVQSGFTPVDLKSDLGARTGASHFVGKVHFKPARKHRIVFEVIPFRLAGENTLSRSFVFDDEPYNAGDRIVSVSKTDYLFLGY